MLGNEEADVNRLIRFSASGAITWQTKVTAQMGEATDVAVAPDESFYILSGHCAGCPGQYPPGKTGGIDGSFSRVESDGRLTWTVAHLLPALCLCLLPHLVANNYRWHWAHSYFSRQQGIKGACFAAEISWKSKSVCWRRVLGSCNGM